MKLNKTYRKHLVKSFLIVIVGLVIVFKEIYPDMTAADNFFVLVMSVICAFLAFFGILVLFIRIGKIKFRRKFMYTFSGVANFCVAGISLFFVLYNKTAAALPLFIYSVSLLVGSLMLTDIFFGKRSPKKQEQEMLIE